MYVYFQIDSDPTNFRQPLSIDTDCSMDTEGVAIKVTCRCREGISVTGYQVIFQRNDPRNAGSLFKVSVYTGSCSNTVVHRVEGSGTYGVSVFPIRGNQGIVTSYVSFFQEILVGNTSSPSTTSTTANSNFKAISKMPNAVWDASGYNLFLQLQVLVLDWLL